MLLLAVLVALFAAMPSAALAEPCPSFEGMSFPTINGHEDPEDFCWEVTLYEDQELRQIDDTHAGVYYEDGPRAMLITAGPAHDSEGIAVPTTLAVTGANLITLTVHHRVGNPAAGGAPFDYPVIAGAGWEGGFQTFEVKGPPDESELKPKPPPPPAEEAPAPMCEIPALQGRILKGARRALLRSGCALGPIRGERRRGARVVKQYRRFGKVLPAGTAVGVRLAP